MGGTIVQSNRGNPKRSATKSGFQTENRTLETPYPCLTSIPAQSPSGRHGGDDCAIGPYCVIGGNVKLGAGNGCAHVVIDGQTGLGRTTTFPLRFHWPETQDLKWKGGTTDAHQPQYLPRKHHPHALATARRRWSAPTITSRLLPHRAQCRAGQPRNHVQQRDAGWPCDREIPPSSADWRRCASFVDQEKCRHRWLLRSSAMWRRTCSWTATRRTRMPNRLPRAAVGGGQGWAVHRLFFQRA